MGAHDGQFQVPAIGPVELGLDCYGAATLRGTAAVAAGVVVRVV